MKKVLVSAEFKEERLDEFERLNNYENLNSESIFDYLRDLDKCENVYARTIEDANVESIINELETQGYYKGADDDEDPIYINEGTYNNMVEIVIIM